MLDLLLMQTSELTQHSSSMTAIIAEVRHRDPSDEASEYPRERMAQELSPLEGRGVLPLLARYHCRPAVTTGVATVRMYHAG
jgi:hypothetical protein